MLADINNKTLLCNRKLISSETNPGLDPKKVRKVPVCAGFSSLLLSGELWSSQEHGV